MTITEALLNYSNGKIIIDKFVYQYVADNGVRVLYRFVIDSNHLYLRHEEFSDFITTTEDIELTDEDVTELLLQSITDFLGGDHFKFDIFDRTIDVSASTLLSEEFLTQNNLQEILFKTY